MVITDTPPSTPLNFSEMIGEDLDLDDLEEINFDDVEQEMSDDSDEVSDLNGEESSREHPDHALVTFRGHSGSVFCCHIDPQTGILAATGGEDERLLLWNSDNGEIVFEGKGFKDSVISVEFSHDGKYIAAGCMRGVIKVWKLNHPNPPLEVLNESYDGVLWLKWHQKANVLLGGVITGLIFMWKIPSGECKVITSTNIACDVGYFMPDGKRAVGGFNDGTIRILDLVSASTNFTIQNPELGSIICLACHQDNNLVAAGTVNSKVILFSSQTGKVLSLLTCLEEMEIEEPESVESVVFSKDQSLSLLAIGTLSRVILYDYSKKGVRYGCNITDGITKLIWDLDSFLFIGTQFGDLQILNVKLGYFQSVLSGHAANILDMSFSRDAKKILTSSDDRTAKVFPIDF